MFNSNMHYLDINHVSFLLNSYIESILIVNKTDNTVRTSKMSLVLNFRSIFDEESLFNHEKKKPLLFIDLIFLIFSTKTSVIDINVC